MSPPPHSPGPNPEGDSESPEPDPVPLRTLLAVNLRVLLVVAALGALAFGLWKGLAALFPELTWLQYPG